MSNSYPDRTGPLRLAVLLEELAGTLRTRSLTLAATARQLRWASPGAAAFLTMLSEITTALLTVAYQFVTAAEEIRQDWQRAVLGQ
jgi:hypothetical protein